MEFVLYRDVFEKDYTLGRLSVDGRPLGYTCEDTDRKLEAYSVAFSKQACIKPVATQAWRFADVAGHWLVAA